MKPTLHIPGLFHTVCSRAFSHCAFTGKVLRFAKMMRAQGYKVIEYSNGTSESEADEHVQMLDDIEFHEFVGDYDQNKANTNTPYFWLFHARLKLAMHGRVKAGDIICHPFGTPHQELQTLFPQCKHIETGIGYESPYWGAYQVFESYAWRHYHLGKYSKAGSDFEWVVPNYFDLDEWTVRETPGEYLLYLGRVMASKGLSHLKALAERVDVPIYVVGKMEEGATEAFAHPRMVFLPPVSGRQRDALVGRALAMLMPTRFLEPFGGAGVEGLLCGTPLISSDFGGMTETVKHGINGYRIHTLGDMVAAVEAVKRFDRGVIADVARNKYSLEACGKQYDKIFQTITDEHAWYTETGRL